jgi:hypothetical protein
MSVDQSQAIDIARHKVGVIDGYPELTDIGSSSPYNRQAVATLQSAVWHVSFPLINDELLGGEPHVDVDQVSGGITNVQYTQ